MTSVDTTTRNGIGVSLRLCPVAAIAAATQAPNAVGSSNAHRFWMITPASSATAKIRMIVMDERLPANLSRVQSEHPNGSHLKLTTGSSVGFRPRRLPDGTRVLFSDTRIRPGARRLFVIAASAGVPKETDSRARGTRRARAAHPEHAQRRGPVG